MFCEITGFAHGFQRLLEYLLEQGLLTEIGGWSTYTIAALIRRGSLLE